MEEGARGHRRTSFDETEAANFTLVTTTKFLARKWSGEAGAPSTALRALPEFLILRGSLRSHLRRWMRVFEGFGAKG
jgi:hypothetical protein